MNSYLHKELFIIAVVGIAALAALFIPLGHDSPFVIRALLQSVLLWALCWQQAWQRRPHNRTNPDSPLLPSLGWANRLTLLRGLLIAICGGFLLQPLQNGFIAWLPALCYSIAAACDRLDGYLARRSHNTTLLGAELDMVFDALGLVIAPLLAVSYGKIHPAYLLVSVAYYLFVWGLYWRRRHRKPVLPLRPSELRRMLAGTQMGFIAVTLWPPLQSPLTQLASIAFMLPLLAGFWIDWLVVSARLPSQTPAADDGFRRVAQLSEQWLQPLLRVVLLAALVLLVVQQTANNPTLMTAALLLGAAGIVLGIAGRACAITLLILMNWYAGFDPVSVVGVSMLFATVWILLLGTGRFSLWQRDADWLNRQDGA